MTVTIYRPGRYEAQSICEHCGTGTKPVHVGYASAIEGLEGDYPTLRWALMNASPAHSPKIEWTTGGFSAVNYCQIVRTPFESSMSEEQALRKHLETTEQVLLFGQPGPGSYKPPFRAATCGGSYYFLNRRPASEDDVRLRVLRDLTFRADVAPRDYDGRRHEWISEFSLQVSPV